MTAELPAGPRWPAVVQSVALLRFRHRFVPALHRRYGDVVTVRLMPTGSPLVLFTRPEHARELFAGAPEVFHAGKGNAILEPVMGEHSLLLQDSAGHRRARRLLMPAFHGAALRGYRPVVAALAREEVAGWVPGRPFRSLDRMTALTLEVILRVVFGVSDPARLERLRPLVRRTVDVSPLVLLGGASPVLRRLPPWRHAVRGLRALDDLVYAEIADRRTATDLATRPDVLSRLLGGPERLGDRELRDQLAAARAAVDRDDDGYLEAVLKESMRLHPVIPMVVRRLTAPATVGGVTLPAGVSVGASILLGHARAESHPEPERFRPRRFLDGEVAAGTWIPFGGGVRRCIGAGFALMEGVAVLREVLLRYDVSLPPGPADRPKVRNITSVPAFGARIVVTAATRPAAPPR